LLREVQGTGEIAGYVRTILTAIQDERQRRIERELDVAVEPMPATRPTTGPEIPKPLTEREIAILRLMAANLSNREIAEELYLSINTIKWYSTTIYGKLGVNKRARAVACARVLGII
jgi:LuxR family maltose regulon positive regulatory protein